MKLKTENLKFLILGAGGLGLALRVALYSTGIDEKGLLISGHPAQIALWILTFLAGIALVFLTLSIQGPDRYGDAFPASLPAALGCFAAAAAFLITALSEFSPRATSLDAIVLVLGIASAVSLVYLGYCRLRRVRPLFLFHAIVCLCLALRMVCQYRLWSSDPQLQDYGFYLTAYVALMLTAYHLAAFDAGMGSFRTLWFLGLASVYLCCLSLAGPRENLLLLACGFWVFTNLPQQKSRSRRVRPTPESEPSGGAG